MVSRPSVAITATELGITLGRTRTVMTVDRALELAGKPQADGNRRR